MRQEFKSDNQADLWPNRPHNPFEEETMKNSKTTSARAIQSQPMLRRIAGNWWIKVIGQKMIGLLPGRLGSALNLKVARLLQGNITERPTASEYRVVRSARNLGLIRKFTGVTLDGAHVLELGTGWRGCDPILFLLCGATKVTTVDHERWLTLESFRHSVDLVRKVWPKIEDEAEQHRRGAVARLTTLHDKVAAAQTLDDALEAVGIDYRIAPDADPTTLGLDKGSVDVFYTESVLQRVPEKKIGRYIDYVCNHCLTLEGAVFHRTDQRDIHTLEHVGNDGWALAYLRFPDWIFNTFLNGRFISQNRLRESDFIRMLTQAGIVLTYIESRRHSDDITRLEKMQLPKRFRGKTPTDLATRCSLLIGHKNSISENLDPIRHEVVGSQEKVES